MRNLDVKLLPAQLEFMRRENEPELAMCAGLASGKSKVGALWLVKRAIANNENAIAAAQTFTSTKNVIFNEIEYWARLFCGNNYTYNRSELKITFPNGAWIIGGSSQSADALTGLTEAQNFLTDESAIMNYEAKKFMADRCRGLKKDGTLIKPKYRYIGTAPVAKDTKWFREFCLANPDKVINAHTEDGIGKIITLEYYNNRLAEYGGVENPMARAQLFGEMIENLNDMCVFHYKRQTSIRPIPMSMGIDLAGDGRDKSVFIVTDGTRIVKKLELDHAHIEELWATAITLKNEFNVKEIRYDKSGIGGLFCLEDKIKDIPVTGIQFGASAYDNAQYANNRAEMYYNCANHWNFGEEFKEERLATIGFINNSGKYQLIRKEDIKKVIEHSPDGLDALCLALYTNDLNPNFKDYNLPSDTVDFVCGLLRRK